MNPNRKRILFVALAVGVMFLLSACTANLVTDLKKDGSGLFTQEYIMTADELSSASIPVGENLCTQDMGLDLSTMPVGTTVRQVVDGDEYHCFFETAFTTLDDLKAIYTDYLDSTVNDLSIVDETLHYDVDVFMGETQNEMGFMVYWIVKLPGSISDHNASSKQGNTLTWELPSSGTLNTTATSNVGGLDTTTILWIAGIGAACLCLVLVAAVIVLIVVLVSRNKKKKQAGVVPPAPQV